eukprot:CAMPEP_0171323628 /NCGR_PEP_ID=MMETSP0816-20121228/115692_1 /TAXON_ID=420281 /ORGANISM="Proboscia inermis, Strain CCAP1064/1" /LENGTH=264 /DNA_ID=CAMNT_0011822381 /DNA_START=26 /DNA_END=817 /DNA_ORIENTATION=+
MTASHLFVKTLAILIVVTQTVSFSFKSTQVRNTCCAFKRFNGPSVLFSTESDVESDQKDINRRSFTRNAIFSTLIAANVINSSDPAIAASEFETYVDKNCGFQISVPVGWEKTTQEISDRRRIEFWFDPSSFKDDDKTLIFIAYTPVRDDYTSLGSFGSVQQMAAMTILPKGNLAGANEGLKSEMISADSKKNAYIFDYTVQPTPNEINRHFRTIFFLAQGATGGAGAQLVTITAQCPEIDYTVQPTPNEINVSCCRALRGSRW